MLTTGCPPSSAAKCNVCGEPLSTTPERRLMLVVAAFVPTTPPPASETAFIDCSRLCDRSAGAIIEAVAVGLVSDEFSLEPCGDDGPSLGGLCGGVGSTLGAFEPGLEFCGAILLGGVDDPPPEGPPS